MSPGGTDGLQLLRHALATLAYRGGKVLREAPEGFGGFLAAPGSRTPMQILAHVGDLLDWALSIVHGKQAWHDTAPERWSDQVERFFVRLAALDAALVAAESELPLERLFQGPIADALTHVGQLAYLRRLAGAPVRGENYFKAAIEAGWIGAEQAPPAREFD